MGTTVIISGAVVTVTAIVAATIAVVLGHLDSAAYASIIGAALGFGAGAGTHAAIARANGTPNVVAIPSSSSIAGPVGPKPPEATP